MSEQGKDKKARDEAQGNESPKIPKKKRKTQPEVIIAPTGPGGPDVSVE